MEWIIISLIFNSVSTVHLLHQEVILIKQLNEAFHDHNIILMDSTLDSDHYVVPDYGKMVPQTIYTFNSGSDDNITPTLNQITSKNTLLVIAVENMTMKDDDAKLLSEVRKIRSANLKVVFFTSKFTSMHAIEQLFQWSWSAGIVNILSVFYSNDRLDSEPLLNVFRFDPFGPSTLENVTSSRSFQNYFSDKIPNFHRHPLRFGIINHLGVGHLEEQLWHSVTVAFNASTLDIGLSAEEYRNISLTEMNEDILKQEVAIVDDVQMYPVYPHRETTFVLMVPHAPYSSIVTFLASSTWELIFLCIFITIIAASLVLTTSCYLRTNKVYFHRCIAVVGNLLMNDNVAVRYCQLPRADVCVLVPLTFSGLIVMNGILSVYQSYLTLPIYERQIKTIDDIFNSLLPILVNKDYWADAVTRVLEDISQHDGWDDRVIRLSYDEIQREINLFNDSVVIPISDALGQASIEVQKRLDLKASYLSDELTLTKFYAAFYINHYFPFTEPLNSIVHRMQNAGLIDKWAKEEHQDVIKNMYATSKFRLQRIGEPDGGKFSVPNVVWLGWICSVVVFACELICYKVKIPSVKNPI